MPSSARSPGCTITHTAKEQLCTALPPPPMGDNKTVYLMSFCVATSLALIWKWARGRAKLPFPPGPKRLPLLGNVLDVPKDVPIWQTFASMARKSSVFLLPRPFPNTLLKHLFEDTDVLYLRLLTTDFVVLNTSEVASEFFEKRSNNYVDRVSSRLQPP